MFRRGRKATAFLVAAASVISMMPASALAADYTKVKDEKGIITKAVAYKDGKFYIDGEPKSKDESVYYLDGGKYSEIKKVDTGDDVEIYGSKYLSIDNDEYYLDLSNGKLSEDEVEEEELDNVSEKLRKAIKSDNDDRYNDTEAKNYKDVTVIPGNKFSDTYYKAEYKYKEKKASVNGNAENAIVYTSADGKYIDADYNVGTIRVKLENNKSVKLENTVKDDNDVRVSVYDIKEIGQNSSNIYRKAKICINSTVTNSAIKEINGIDVENDSKYFKVDDNGKKVTFDVIQVISKAQSSKDIDGIKYAKTVENYMICEEDGDEEELLTNGSFSIIDNKKLLCYEIDGSNVYTEVIELKSKGSKYYVDVDDTDEIELTDGENSFDVDVSGNLWAISDEYIYKFNNKSEWKKVYKVNDDFDSLSVYDEKNMIAWSEDEEVYSIISSKSSNSSNSSSSDNNTNTNTNNTNNNNSNNNSNNNTSTLKGWVFGQDGKWYFYKNDGTKAVGWYKDGATWYYLNANGDMKTGWLYDNGTWYYLKESGAMATGWINDGGTWYYLNAAGAMLSNTTVDGYKLGPTGAWIK